jgi:16S rRNA processing protein RimM
VATEQSSPAADAALGPDAGGQADRRIELGRIGGPHGVRGWVRIGSDTEPPENILRYRPWLVGDVEMVVAEGRRQGKALVARLVGCDERDAAAALTGKIIAVRRRQLPPPRPDEFYWADLEGLAVATPDGVALGTVSHLFATGANDVIVVAGERERLVPFLWGQVVQDIDFAQRRIVVDWDPDF